MARKGRGQDKSGRSKRTGQFAALPYAMLESAAWRSLSGAAVKVYLELHRRYWGGNNGAVSLSMGEAAALFGMSKATVKAAFDELAAKGFLAVVKRGHWYGRQATEYRITKEKCGRDPATNEWKNWQPVDAENLERGTVAEPSGLRMVR